MPDDFKVLDDHARAAIIIISLFDLLRGIGLNPTDWERVEPCSSEKLVKILTELAGAFDRVLVSRDVLVNLLEIASRHSDELGANDADIIGLVEALIRPRQ